MCRGELYLGGAARLGWSGGQIALSGLAVCFYSTHSHSAQSHRVGRRKHFFLISLYYSNYTRVTGNRWRRHTGRGRGRQQSTGNTLLVRQALHCLSVSRSLSDCSPEYDLFLRGLLLHSCPLSSSVPHSAPQTTPPVPSHLPGNVLTSLFQLIR